jgi:hypothetical protein
MQRRKYKYFENKYTQLKKIKSKYQFLIALHSSFCGSVELFIFTPTDFPVLDTLQLKSLNCRPSRR